ncbi:MAG: cation diffusion facilitator family transporter, partial [Alphaproteobacteria bacterium]|nr:cation diffusion facilitator family transporter [Alphaproteobacteria bacterium]
IFVAVRYSLQPPDAEHRFGHGKAEDVASFAQAAFITGSALFIGFEAIGRFLNPRPIDHGTIGIAVMAVSILLTLALVLFQHYVIRRTNSTAIHSDSLHYVGDVLVNSAVIASLVMESTLGWQLADPITALLISGYILYNAWQIATKAFQHLMDREFSDEDREKIIQTVLKNPGAKGIHALRTRRSGITPFIQFHLEMDGETTLFDAHNVVEDIHAELVKLFPGGEVIIHEDPTEIDEAHRDEDRRVAD